MLVGSGAVVLFHAWNVSSEALMAYPATHFSLCMFQIPEKRLGTNSALSPVTPKHRPPKHLNCNPDVPNAQRKPPKPATL